MLLYNLLLCSGARCPHRELALLLLRRLLREPHARRHLHPLLDRNEPVSSACRHPLELKLQRVIDLPAQST